MLPESFNLSVNLKQLDEDATVINPTFTDVENHGSVRFFTLRSIISFID